MKKSTHYFRLSTLILIILFSVTNVYAENHALLIGIANYHIKPLSGPINDVTLLKSILTEKWSFKKDNIKLILNKAGTKKNILAGIKSLYKNSKPGDNIFIYMSGHGTSARDKSFNSPLPTTSGAFIPIDIENLKSKSEIIKHLIIGRTDLKPLLQKFDNNGRHVFVAIDACYSGNTVRGLYTKQQLPSRFISLNEISSSSETIDETIANTLSESLSNNNSNLYPYKNIYYLSASGEYEPAQEIKPEMLDRFPTIDGKPHGAFSDTLLRVLNKDLIADNNHDGLITYSELKNTMRYFMRIRGFDHTPHGLPSLAEDQGKLASRGIFGHQNKNKVEIIKPKKIPSKKLTSHIKQEINKKTKSKIIKKIPNNILQIVIDKSLTKIREIISTIENVKIVNKNGQVELRQEDNSVLFISQAGDLILKLQNPTDVEIFSNIQHQIWIKQLVDGDFKQNFNIDLDMFANGRGSTVVEGDTIGVAIKSTQTAHILIININAQGSINVLYPYTKSELTALNAYKLLAFKELSKVIPPFGREYIQVYAFKNDSSDYRDLMGKSFNRRSPYAKILMQLLQNESIEKSRASLEIVTTKVK